VFSFRLLIDDAISIPYLLRLLRVIEAAATYVRMGRDADAERVIRSSVVFSQLGSNLPIETKRQDAHLLALLAEILARGSAARTPNLFSAESYVAWAIHTWPCSLQSWQKYVEIRLRRQGSEALLDLGTIQ